MLHALTASHQAWSTAASTHRKRGLAVTGAAACHLAGARSERMCCSVTPSAAMPVVAHHHLPMWITSMLVMMTHCRTCRAYVVITIWPSLVVKVRQLGIYLLAMTVTTAMAQLHIDVELRRRQRSQRMTYGYRRPSRPGRGTETGHHPVPAGSSWAAGSSWVLRPCWRVLSDHRRMVDQQVLRPVTLRYTGQQ